MAGQQGKEAILDNDRAAMALVMEEKEREPQGSRRKVNAKVGEVKEERDGRARLNRMTKERYRKK